MENSKNGNEKNFARDVGESLSEEGIQLISDLASSEEEITTLTEEDIEAVRKFAEAIKNLTHEQKQECLDVLIKMLRE